MSQAGRMIVICTKCQAKFRVADERVGPRGAKVRCSRCQTVFVARPEGEPPRPPPLPPPLPARPPPPASAAPVPSLPVDPFAAADGPDPFGSPRTVDPFAFGTDDPFASAVPARVADPLAGGADPFAGGADPFAEGGDPFAGGGAPDPFGVREAAHEVLGGSYEGGRLPVTDLGDLLGPPSSPPARPSLEAAPPPAAQDGLEGLALEDRTTPVPAPLSRAEFGGRDDLGMGAFDPSPFEFGAPAGEALALAGEPDVPQRPAPDADGWGELDATALQAEPAPPLAAAARAPAPRAEPAAKPAAPEPAPEARVPGRRGSRVRAAVVNAIALAALLLAALAILVVWRAEGPLDASSFRPSSIVAALRTGAAPGPFATQGIRSGLYEREKGPPFLFVRGSVVSRATAPVASVEVAVEVLREGQVIAHGKAVAGAVPTPEELHRAADAAALAAVARAAEARAPAEVRPGEVVPFLVAISDHPADLSGASLRIAVAGGGADAR